MPEEVNGQEPETKENETSEPQVSPESWLDTIDPDAKKEILKLRKEAAAKRVLSKEQEAELADYQKWKESQMTELEKAQAKIAALEQDNKSARRLRAAQKAELDPDLVDHVLGDSDDEMLESAKALAEKMKAANPGGRGPVPSPSDFAGRRGGAVTDKDADLKNRANDMMRGLMRRAS